MGGRVGEREAQEHIPPIFCVPSNYRRYSYRFDSPFLNNPNSKHNQSPNLISSRWRQLLALYSTHGATIPMGTVHALLCLGQSMLVRSPPGPSIRRMTAAFGRLVLARDFFVSCVFDIIYAENYCACLI